MNRERQKKLSRNFFLSNSLQQREEKKHTHISRLLHKVQILSAILCLGQTEKVSEWNGFTIIFNTHCLSLSSCYRPILLLLAIVLRWLGVCVACRLWSMLKFTGNLGGLIDFQLPSVAAQMKSFVYAITCERKGGIYKRENSDKHKTGDKEMSGKNRRERCR